jgi:hypothetical protein
MRYRLASGYELAFWLLVAAAGLAVALAPFALPGLVLGGSACGGGGNEQVCLGIARELTLVQVSDRAWVWVAGGALIAVVAMAALVLPRADVRLGAAAFVLALAVVGVAHTAEIDAKLGPEGGGTWGRADEDWGPFLRPALLDLRADKVRELEGQRQRPGAQPYERDQILDSFSARPQAGWKLLRAALVVLLFVSAFETARRLLRSPITAAVVALTGGGLAWAVLEDRAFQCDPGASDCYKGLLTIMALVAAGFVWAIYGLVVLLVRATRPRLRRPRG